MGARATPIKTTPRTDQVPGSAGFVHLHVHSSYSLREGAHERRQTRQVCRRGSMPALAITDTNNLFGALEFSDKLAKEGMQPITGLQITLDFQRWRGDGAARRGEAPAMRPSCSLRRMRPAIST